MPGVILLYNTNLLDRIQPEVAVEAGQSIARLTRGKVSIIAVISLIGVSWSTTGIAASESNLPCDSKVARDLQSLAVEVGTLSATTVDHEIAAADSVPASDSSSVDSTVAPRLDLTPRIVGILDTVFENGTAAEVADESDPEAAATQDQVEKKQQKTAPLTSNDDGAEAQGFQIRMFRKDI